MKNKKISKGWKKCFESVDEWVFGWYCCRCSYVVVVKCITKNNNNKKRVKNSDNWQLQPNDSIYNCKKMAKKNVVKNPRSVVVLVVAVVKCAKCQRQQRRHNTVFCILFCHFSPFFYVNVKFFSVRVCSLKFCLYFVFGALCVLCVYWTRDAAWG